MGRRPDARPVLQARRGPSGVVGGPLRLQTRVARAPLALGPSTERGGAHAGGVGVDGTVGVARAAAQAGAPAKRRRIGPKVAQETGPTAPSLVDLARLAARVGGLVRPPPVTLSQSLSCGMGGGDSDDPLFLEFLRVCTPHLGWLSAELRVTPCVLVKRLTLFVDRVFDTAQDFRLPSAARTLVMAVQGLRREDWRGLLHVTTSPIPRAGKVNPDILLNGLGPMGSHVIPEDIWEQAVPLGFYGQGLRDFDVETPGSTIGVTPGRGPPLGFR